MNTMLMSVAERTREFGILKAIGAETRDICFLPSGKPLLWVSSAESLNSCRHRGCLSHEFLACKYKDCTLPDNAQASYNCHAVCLANRGSFRAYPAYRASKMSPMEALKHA